MDRSLVSVKVDACGAESDCTAASGCDDLKSPYTTAQDEGNFDAADGAGGLTEADVRRMRSVFEHEVSNNTRMNYRAQWRRFTDWARSRSTNALPADPVQVAAYLAERMELHKHKPATLRAAAAAIGFIHRSSGLGNPCDTEEVKKRSAERHGRPAVNSPRLKVLQIAHWKPFAPRRTFLTEVAVATSRAPTRPGAEASWILRWSA